MITRRQFGAAALGAAFMQRKPGFAEQPCSKTTEYRDKRPLTLTTVPPKVRAILPKNNKIERPLLSSWQNQPDKLTTLTRAYSVLAQTTGSTGLLNQAKLHNQMCADDANNVHNSWAFLVWHRGFLYFHERILRKIIGDDQFRLPIWDWETSKPVPEPWRNRQVDPNLVTACDRTPALPFNVTDCRLQAWLFSSSFQQFVGGVDGPGNAYKGVHNDVHSQLAGAMAVPATAAADPLFYAHHANVDRYWWYWTKTLEFKADPGFCDQWFLFYDENGHPVWVCSDQLMDPGLLGYSYEDHPPTVALNGLGLVPLTGLGSAQSRWDAVRTGISWLNNSQRSQILGLAQNLSKSLLQLGAALPGLGHLPQLPLTSQLINVLTSARVSLPLRIGAELSGNDVKPGQYYSVALKSPDGASINIAGFGVFCNSSQHSVEILATGCFGPDALNLLLTAGGRVEMVYGPANPSGEIVGAKPILNFALDLLGVTQHMNELPSLPH
jgi:hypothetical protein